MVSVLRKEELKRIITEKKAVTVSEMATYFSVSTETIRRDLDALEKEGIIKKSYGGASLIRHVSSAITQKEKLSLLVEEKQHIAQNAASFIHPNDCIFLDSSTTVLSICPYLEDVPITVVTNSLPIINALSNKSNIKLISIGGAFDSQTQSFLGQELVVYLNNHCFDKSFFSCRCIDAEKGLCDSSDEIANMHRLIISNSRENFLLADHTKLGRTAFSGICSLDKINHFITDKPLSSQWNTIFSNLNIDIVVAENNES